MSLKQECDNFITDFQNTFKLVETGNIYSPWQCRVTEKDLDNFVQTYGELTATAGIPKFLLAGTSPDTKFACLLYAFYHIKRSTGVIYKGPTYPKTIFLVY